MRSNSRAALALAAFAALLLLPGLGRMGAFDSTDARYLAIAHEMRISGDWMVPRLGGAPHLDKPPLAYWAGALGQALAGRGEFGGRLVQQAFVLGTALVVLAAARRRIAAGWALPAGLVFLTSALPFATSRGLATDHFQLAFVSVALVALFEASRRGAARWAALAGAALGLSMLAKGPIALAVVAATWLAFVLGAPGRARLPGRGVVLGLALCAAIGLPWYALLVSREPAVLPWLLDVQLASRVTGTGAGHVKDPTWLLRLWPVALLPWTPVVALALWRLAPRRPGADPADALVLAWAVAPVVLFSLFPTKLAGYILPALPGAALAVARAGSRGLLDDRAGRLALAASFATTAAAALAAGALLLAARRAGAGWLPASIDAGRLEAPWVFGMALLATGAVAAAGAWRARAVAARSACTQLACVAGLGLALAFHAVARALPTLRDEAALARAVPGARLVALSFKPGLFFYLEPEVPVYVAGVRGLVEPFVEPAEAARLTLSRDAAAAMLRADAPTFAWADARESASLARETSAREVARDRRYRLLANPPALRALGRTR